MDRYAMAVELLQNDTPFVAAAAARTVTEVAEDATVVATAAGVAAAATVTVPDTGCVASGVGSPVGEIRSLPLVSHCAAP
jgi:hypothetical protein